MADYGGEPKTCHKHMADGVTAYGGSKFINLTTNTPAQNKYSRNE